MMTPHPYPTFKKLPFRTASALDTITISRAGIEAAMLIWVKKPKWDTFSRRLTPPLLRELCKPRWITGCFSADDKSSGVLMAEMLSAPCGITPVFPSLQTGSRHVA